MYKIIQILVLSLLTTLLTVSLSFSFEKNLVLQGTAGEIHNELTAALKARKFAKAEEILSNLLTSRRNSPDGIRMLEDMYNRLTEFSEPAILDEWCASRSQSHFPLVVRGNYLLQRMLEFRGTSMPRLLGDEVRKNIDELKTKAEIDYEGAYSINPADAASASGMVAISLARGYPRDIMEKWFKRAVESDPVWLSSYKRKLFYLAPWWYGSKEEMETFVESCFKNSPKGSVVYTIALNYFLIPHDNETFWGSYLPHSYVLPPDQEAMSIEAMAQLRRDCPNSPYPDYYQGRFYQMGSSDEEALSFFTKARARDAKFLKAWIGQAYSELVLNRFGKAEETLNEILKLDPDSTFALMNLGYVRMLVYNDFSGGLELFNQAVRTAKDVRKKMDGLYFMARFLQDKGKYSESISYFSQVLEIDPVFTRALLGRASARKELGDLDGALQDALTVIDIGDQDTVIAKQFVENLMKKTAKTEVATQAEEAAIAPSTPVNTAAEPPVSSSNTIQPHVVDDTPAEHLDITTAEIRQTIDNSPTAVVDNSSMQEHLNTCEAFYFRRLKDEAIDCFSEILLQAPEYAKTYFMLGRIAEKLEADLKKAASYYNKAISKDQGNQEYILSLGQVLYMERNFTQAVQVLTKLVEINPTHGEAYYQRGMCFDALGNKEQAIEDMQKASIYTGKNEASEYLSQNVVISPPAPTFDKEQELLFLSQQNIAMQRYDQAEKQLQEVLKINPGNDQATFQLGILYIHRDHDQKKALAQYNKAIQLNAENKDYYTNRAVAFEALEDYRKAAQDYSSALKFYPKDGYLYGKRAACMMKLGEYEKAQEDVKKAMTLSTGSRDHYNRMLAEISAKTGVQLTEDLVTPAILVERARFHAEAKEFDLARKNLLQAIQLDPKFAHAYYELGRMSAEKLRLPEEALSWFDKAIELEQGNRDYFFHRGLVYFQKQDYKTAKIDFSRALELQKDDTQIYYYRGVCNKKLDLKEQAIEDLLKARENPGWVQAVNGLLSEMM